MCEYLAVLFVTCTLPSHASQPLTRHSITFTVCVPAQPPTHQLLEIFSGHLRVRVRFHSRITTRSCYSVQGVLGGSTVLTFTHRNHCQHAAPLLRISSDARPGRVSGTRTRDLPSETRPGPRAPRRPRCRRAPLLCHVHGRARGSMRHLLVAMSASLGATSQLTRPGPVDAAQRRAHGHRASVGSRLLRASDTRPRMCWSALNRYLRGGPPNPVGL